LAPTTFFTLRDFAGDKRLVFTEAGSYRTKHVLEIDTDSMYVVKSQASVGITKLLYPNGSIEATGFSPTTSFKVDVKHLSSCVMVVTIRGNGYDPLATIPIPFAPLMGYNISYNVPPPGITYRVTFTLDMAAGTLDWEGEHDAFPAHELFINHELVHGFLPRGDSFWDLLHLAPFFPNVDFDSNGKTISIH
jgi:hypothetical protein